MSGFVDTDGRVAFQAGYSRLENVMLLPPIANSIFSFLNTPDHLCMRCTSRTLRVFTDANRRFFRNMVFLRRGVERWLDLLESPALDNILTEEHLRFLLHKTTVDVVDRGLKRQHGAVELNHRIMEMLVEAMSLRGQNDSTISFWHRKTKDTEKELSEIILRTPRVRTIHVSEFYLPTFMGRHLAQVLNNLPIGKNVTSIVLDGTGVDTEWIQLIMGRFASTLRGLSTRDCKNIDGYVFSDWILECKYRHQPLALRWLRVWGSGGFPHVFSTECPMDPVTPLDIHPDDEHAGGPKPLPHTSKLFANLITNEFHRDYTRLVMAPMYKYGAERTAWLREMAEKMDMCFEKFDELHTNTPEPFAYWDAPLEPLGDVNPVIALLVISRYFDIKIDIALCASQHFCWSFVLAADAADSTRHQHNLFTVGGRAYRLAEAAGQFARHTHCIAEVGARRNEGGQCCHICGLWEGSPAPYEFCTHEENDCIEVGGVTSGSGIGTGRLSIGSLCAACCVFMTCAECGKFVCQSCFFRNPSAPQNPFMVSDTPGEKLVKVVCEKPGHGAECADCIATRTDLYFECDDCGRGYCLRCRNPSGRQVSTDLYGGYVDTYYNSENFDVPGARVKGGRSSLFVDNPLYRLEAFKPLTPQTPGSPTVVHFEETNLFEFCVGCDSGRCRRCIKVHAWKTDVGLEKRPTASKYRHCNESGCGKSYCEECVNICAKVCVNCNTWVLCRMCDLMGNIITGVPDALQENWCGEPGCMDSNEKAKLDDLKGPWEDGWVPEAVVPLPSEDTQIAS